MIQTSRRPARFKPTILLAIFGLAVIIAGVLPASQAAIARMLADNDGPAWLQMVEQPNELYTEYSLARLSGRLIMSGEVNASECVNGGLDADQNATDCGIKVAQTTANAWQNRFNAAILATSRQEGVPPRLLKNLFAWESQFWPERLYINTFEYGLGHITVMGADTKRVASPREIDSMRALVWKPFAEDAAAPTWIRRKERPAAEPHCVTVTAFRNGWCPAMNLVCERAKAIASEPQFAERVRFREIDTFERPILTEWGISDGLYIDRKEVRTGPPPTRDKIRRLIARRVRKLR